MKPFVWQEGMSVEETKNGAYWERNMLALLLANVLNQHVMNRDDMTYNSGWYVHGVWEGWSRVVSLNRGAITFHVPDDFDLGRLPQIEPNWDGHTTEEKWQRVMHRCGIEVNA